MCTRLQMAAATFSHVCILFALLLGEARAQVNPKACSMELYDPELASCCSLPTILPLYSLKTCIKNENQGILETDPFCLFDCVFKNKNYLFPNGSLNRDFVIDRFYRVLSEKIWQQVVQEAVVRCHDRLVIDASLQTGQRNGCRLHPALFALCVRRNLLGNCPRLARPKTDSNSCTQRLSLIQEKCDPFALVPKKTNPTVISDEPIAKAGTNKRNSGEKAETITKLTTTTTEKAATTKLTSKTTEKSARTKLTSTTTEKAATTGSTAKSSSATTEKRAEKEKSGEVPQIEEMGRSLETVQRHIRDIESLKTPQARQDLASQVRRELDTIAEDVEVLGQERPEVLQVAPRLAKIRADLGSFDSLNLAEGLSGRLVLEVGAVRDQLLRVATNIQKGLSDVGETIRSDVSKVAIDVASGAVGLGSAVGTGLKEAGNSIRAGVNSAQSGIASLSLESIGQLQKIGDDVSASVSNVKKNFEELRQESSQKLIDASSSLSTQLTDGLKSLQKLKDESTGSAKMLAQNIQQNLKERLDEITKQFSNLKLTGK
ncbi:Hypothetical predicted protein [Cloeon dipterum]|uniref:Uncharacterized protein n=1 Tax=Cloeon dipterum TaxID=197152 RepID=A0A8S1D6E6_9INSE|nr:Hypothetical predicted protein [Cloeon dipterum]